MNKKAADVPLALVAATVMALTTSASTFFTDPLNGTGNDVICLASSSKERCKL